jgi:Beta-propeller repeat
MLLLTRKYFALAAAVMVAGLSTGCSGQKKAGDDLAGKAQVAVSTEAIVQGDVDHIRLTITGTGINPAITSLLTKGAAGNVWNASVTNIPAAPAPGADRLFKAEAFNAANARVYVGEATAKVISGQTARVMIMLQEDAPPPSTENYAPRVTSVTSSNAYVLPGTILSFGVAAMDPDHVTSPGGTFDGEPLAYLWSATCTAGTASFIGGTETTSAATFRAPDVSSTCTIKINVKEQGAVSTFAQLSVATYFTIVVNADFGDAYVYAFPNTFPLITARGDIRYNYASSGTTMPVGQEGDFFFTAIDPDGDNVRYDLTAKCGADLTAAAAASPIAASYFDAVTLTTDAASFWNPVFRGYTDPTQDCVFTMQVHDLCTNGNCVGDPAAVGALADGSDKLYTIAGSTFSSVSTAIINTTHPASALRAPRIVRVNNGATETMPLAGGPTWDPKHVLIVAPSSSYNLMVEATDEFEAGPLSIAWSCNVGSIVPGVLTTTAKDLHSEVAFATPGALALGMECFADVTSNASSLTTRVTFKFAGSDPCVVNNLAVGATCDDGSVCTGAGAGETATCDANHVCRGGTQITCPADAQCQAAFCNAITGCGVTNLSDQTSCNSDTSGCTANDHCNGSGACVVGSAVTCTTPADAQCQNGVGACVSQGVNSSTCSYTSKPDATSCNADSNGCTANDACVAGACTPGAAPSCTQSGNPCQSAGGTCLSTGATTFSCNFPNVGDGTGCNTAGLCVTGQSCLAGSCQGGTAACPAGQSCIPATGACLASVVAPVVARDLQLSPPSGIAMDSAGNTLVAGNIFTNVDVNFQTRLGGTPIPLRSLGGIDAFVAKYDAAGDITWAVTIADDDSVSFTNDQTATSAAATANGTVAAIGKVIGSVTFGASTVSSASALPYVGAFASADGARLWAKGYNLGSNGAFRAISASASSSLNRIAVCGTTNTAATQLVPGTTFGGLTDLVVAVFDSNGNKLWATQLGGTGNENCNAVTVDDNGDVYAAGQFDGASLTFPGAPALTGPGTTTRKFMWVAKFAGAGNGSGGPSTLRAVAYNGTSGTVNPNGLAIGPSGEVVVGGQFAANLTIGAAMTSNGGDDGFIAKLDGTALAPVWNALQFGGTALDFVKSVSVTSFGDIVATGTFNPATAAFRSANGSDTIGALTLTATGTTASDMFVAKFNGDTGARDGQNAYGDAGTQNGDGIVVNRSGGDQITFVGALSGSANFGPAGNIAAAGGTDAVLVFSHLQ